MFDIKNIKAAYVILCPDGNFGLLQSTVKSLSSGIYAVIFDGNIDKDVVSVCERANVKFLTGMNAKSKASNVVNIFTADDF